MTDTYVEKLIVDKFLEIESLESVPKCYQYFYDNKDSDEPLEAFEAFIPDYPEGASLDKKNALDSESILILITWFKDTYPNFYKTEEGSPEDDELYEAIKEVILTTKTKFINLYDKDGVLYKYNAYPNVAFPNSDFVRPTDSNGNNTYWYEMFFIPAAPNQIELGTSGRSRWVGIMQINICLPKTWGTDELYARYDEIAALFRSGLILEGVRIVRTYRSSALDDDDYYCLPVTIEWQADLDR